MRSSSGQAGPLGAAVSLYTVLIGYPSAAREASVGYFLVAEKTAAEARAFQMERQRNATAQASDEHRKRLAAAERAARDTFEIEIQSYELQHSEKNCACAVTAERLNRAATLKGQAQAGIVFRRFLMISARRKPTHPSRKARR